MHDVPPVEQVFPDAYRFAHHAIIGLIVLTLIVVIVVAMFVWL